MRIGLDIMGGDFAPEEPLKGALSCREELPADVELVLIGNKDVIGKELENQNSSFKFEIIHASEVIEMGEHPTKATVQKTDSSIVKGLQLLKNGEIDSFISAGNTGAVYVATLYSVKATPNISRPAIYAGVPRSDGSLGVLLDVGANADCKAEHLFQFGILGSVYAETILGINNPKVGLLNIGEEATKGNILTQSAYGLMNNTDKFNFVGNVEGRDLLTHKADVIVTDGFTGNVALKAIESVFHAIKELNKDAIDIALEKFNYENYGGTAILGVNAPVIIGHGISKAKTFKNMVLLAKKIVESDLISRIKKIAG